MTILWQQPVESVGLLDVEACFTAFQEACVARAPFCDSIALAWRAHFGEEPYVDFCLAPGLPEQILYAAHPRVVSKPLYLNGFWTGEHRLERDLLEHFPDDEWARLGARNAAHDLLAIQRTAHTLMLAQQDDSRQETEWDWTGRRYQSFLQGGPLEDPSSWSTYEDECHIFACKAIFERVSDFTSGLHTPADGERLPATL